MECVGRLRRPPRSSSVRRRGASTCHGHRLERSMQEGDPGSAATAHQAPMAIPDYRKRRATPGGSSWNAVKICTFLAHQFRQPLHFRLISLHLLAYEAEQEIKIKSEWGEQT
ncbi:hypothetical protein MRX96_022926 [Rhipicephalus microplus]